VEPGDRRHRQAALTVVDTRWRRSDRGSFAFAESHAPRAQPHKVTACAPRQANVTPTLTDQYQWALAVTEAAKCTAPKTPQQCADRIPVAIPGFRPSRPARARLPRADGQPLRIMVLHARDLQRKMRVKGPLPLSLRLAPSWIAAVGQSAGAERRGRALGQSSLSHRLSGGSGAPGRGPLGGGMPA